MDYSRSIPFQGEPRAAFDHAITVLATHGFKIERQAPREIELTGPSMNSTKQNPLVGATRVVVRADRESLDLNAELGGVQRMRKFLHVFPSALALGLGLFFGIGMGIVFGQQFGVGFGIPMIPGWRWIAFIVPIATLPLVPWHFLSPLMSRGIRRRTEQSLDTLLANMKAVAEAE